jgi:hypothetical protein
MLDEDQYLDRTPDLVAKVRKMRKAAEKEMNRFTRAADYDVRRVVGQKPKAAVSCKTASPSETSTITQSSIDFSPAPTERGDAGEVRQ